MGRRINKRIGGGYLMLTQLIGFRIELESMVDEILDSINTVGYDDKFNLKIETNGKKVNLELHADLYSNLLTFVDISIEEEWRTLVSSNNSLYDSHCITELELAAIRFLKATDRNGDYDDWKNASQTIKYFIWYATTDISDSSECMDGGEDAAMDIVMKANQYHKAIELLIALAMSDDDEANYRSIWSHNVTGFIDGLYTVK
jgi:hypothetical protein